MISATFDGAERQFNIEGKHLPYLESAMGRSLFGIRSYCLVDELDEVDFRLFDSQ